MGSILEWSLSLDFTAQKFYCLNDLNELLHFQPHHFHMITDLFFCCSITTKDHSQIFIPCSLSLQIDNFYFPLQMTVSFETQKKYNHFERNLTIFSSIWLNSITPSFENVWIKCVFGGLEFGIEKAFHRFEYVNSE